MRPGISQHPSRLSALLLLPVTIASTGIGCSRAPELPRSEPPPLSSHGPPPDFFRRSPLSAAVQLPPGQPIRVMFIGNSLTGAHELPRMVQAMAASVKVPLEFNACMRGGASLQDHWKDRRCRAIVAEENWDYVILQQGPSTRPESRADLVAWSRRWSDEIRKSGARPALYMVWAPRSQPNGIAQARDSYATAARASRAILFPAAAAWIRAAKRDSDITLFDRDNFHPSLAGSYLVSLVITRGVIGEAADSIPDHLEIATGRQLELDPSTCARLKRIAKEEADSLSTHRPEIGTSR